MSAPPHYRNLTKKFIDLRNSFRTKRPPINSDNSSLLSDASSTSSSSSYGSVNAPLWVPIVDEIKSDLKKVFDTMKALEKLHQQRLKISFGGDDIIAQQERDIEILSQEITRLLKKSENNIKRIAVIEGDNSIEDRKARINVMRALGADLQTKSKSFRQLQKNFLKNLRDQQQLGETFGFDSSDDDKKSGSRKKGGGGGGGIIDDEALDKGLSAEQSAQLSAMAERSDERYREIIKIAQSVSEISTLFRELNVLVIEQGTILDRIDYNIEQTLQKVEKGVVHLKEADKQSKKAYTMKCIILLAVIMLILLIVLIVKSSSN